MSKGLGRVGRTIEAAFAADPNNAFTVGELCALAYPATEFITKAQSVAVLRAAKARRAAGFDSAYLRSKDRGGELVFYMPDNVRSYAMATLKADHRFDEEDPLFESEEELKASLRKGGKRYRQTIKGGGWHFQTEMFRAERDGDAKKLKRLKAEQDAGMAKLLEAFKKATGR